MPLAKVKSKYSRSNPRGQSLIEMLVAIIFGSLIAVTLTTLLAQTMSQSSTSQNEQTANSIAEELIDYSRAISFATLTSLIGSYELLPNQELAGRPPVIIDLAAKTWTEKSIANLFNGTVTYTIAPLSAPEQLQVSVLVTWADSSNINRKVLTTTLISQYGSQYGY